MCNKITNGLNNFRKNFLSHTKGGSREHCPKVRLIGTQNPKLWWKYKWIILANELVQAIIERNGFTKFEDSQNL